MVRSLALALLAGLLAGCTSYAPNRLTLPSEVIGGEPTLEIVNEDLQEDAEIQADSARFTYLNNVGDVFVRVRNHCDEEVRVEYRWSFYDQDDRQIQADHTSWQSKWLPELAEVEFSDTAPTTEPIAVCARLELRYYKAHGED